MYAPYDPFFALIPEILSKNVAVGAMALMNSMGALGSFISSYAVGYLNDATGNPRAAYGLMAVALLLAAAVTLIGRFIVLGKGIQSVRPTASKTAAG